MGIETQAVVRSEFEFVDLRDSGIADRVRRREWDDNFVPRGQMRPPPEPKTIVSFRVEIPTRDLSLITAQLQSLVERYNISVKFDN